MIVEVEVEEKEINSNISMLYVCMYTCCCCGWPCIVYLCVLSTHLASVLVANSCTTDLYNRLTVSASAAGLS